jgi:hypothetical protein
LLFHPRIVEMHENHSSRKALSHSFISDNKKKPHTQKIFPGIWGGFPPAHFFWLLLIDADQTYLVNGKKCDGLSNMYAG